MEVLPNEIIEINKCLANVTQKNYFHKGESKDLSKVFDNQNFVDCKYIFK